MDILASNDIRKAVDDVIDLVNSYEADGELSVDEFNELHDALENVLDILVKYED